MNRTQKLKAFCEFFVLSFRFWFPNKSKSKTWNSFCFTFCIPRSLNSNFVLPFTKSKTLFEIVIPFVWAKASSLAAIFTQSPRRLPFSLITSPEFIPIRNSSLTEVSSGELRSWIASWNATAHSTAYTALGNSARYESPPVLKRRASNLSNN